MNLKALKAMLAKKEARKAELGTKAKTSGDVKELRAINDEVDALNKDIAEIRSVIDSLVADNSSVKKKNSQRRSAAPDADDGDEDEFDDEVDDEDDEDEDEEDDQEQRGQKRKSGGEQRGGSPVGRSKILGTYGLNGGQTTDEVKRQKELKNMMEKRGADLKAKKPVEFDLDEMPELRATTIGGGGLVVETKYSRTLNPTFNEVSRVVDTVNSFQLNGGESYEKGFEKSIGEGDYTTETGDYAEADPVFDYVTIGKAKITAYAEMTDESTKLPNVDYQSRVRQSMVNALRKKLSKQILVGSGGANALRGIFNAPTNVIPTSTDLVIGEIDADTLDNIVIGYGGDEEVEGIGYLVLNKKDLAAFAAVRDANGKKLYKIKTNGNTGTISSEESFEVPFIINSVCPALSASGTAQGTYCMTYGMMQGYELPFFSPVTVEESRDYKFRSGQIAFRGSVWAGGNVAMFKGFTRVKKA